MKKVLLSIIIIMIMFIPISQSRALELYDSTREEALILYDLGLLKGTSKGLALNNKLTRVEGAVMLVRLLGKEASIEQDYSHPFKDVPKWADGYIGYLYSNNIVYGISKDSFGVHMDMTANEYVTLLLRVLGYNDLQGDFKWNKALDKALEIDVINGSYNEYINESSFLRKDMAYITYRFLKQEFKNKDKTLIEDLVKKEVVELNKVKEYNLKEENKAIDFQYDGIKPEEISWGMDVEDIKEIYGNPIEINTTEKNTKKIIYYVNDGKVSFNIDNRKGLYSFVVKQYRYKIGSLETYNEYINRQQKLNEKYDKTIEGFSSYWGPENENIYDRNILITEGYGYESSIIKFEDEFIIIDIYSEVNGKVITKENIDDINKDGIRVVIREYVGKGSPPKTFENPEEWIKNNL